jgi:RNA polymerase sigma-70 factor (ECF subfamily)
VGQKYADDIGIVHRLISLEGVTATIEDRLVIGDASVLKEIYAQHGSLIHTIAYHLHGPAADQFTISTFVEAWRERRDFDPSKGTVQAWLIRRLRSRLSNNDDLAAEVIDRVVVTASLARMDSTRREILLAGAATDTGATTELAEYLNLPVGTVRAHLRRGMETLQSELADSRSDGDASSLVEIVRSRRLETDVVQPGRAIWDAIWTTVAADAAADGEEFDDGGGVMGADVPVTPDPFGALRHGQDRALDRRRTLVEVEADALASVGGTDLSPTQVSADVPGLEFGDYDTDFIDAEFVEAEGSDYSFSPPADETAELKDLPSTLRGPSSTAARSDDDPTLVSAEWSAGIDDIEGSESAVDALMLDGGDPLDDQAGDEPARSVLESPGEERTRDQPARPDAGPVHSVLESPDGEPSDDDGEQTEADSAVFAGPGRGPKTEADRAIALLRESVDDPEPSPHRHVVAIAGVVAALVVLVVLFLIVL